MNTSISSNILDGLDSERVAKSKPRRPSRQKLTSNMGFDDLYRTHLTKKIDNSEYGKQKIRMLNREITKIKKMFNEQ